MKKRLTPNDNFDNSQLSMYFIHLEQKQLDYFFHLMTQGKIIPVDLNSLKCNTRLI